MSQLYSAAPEPSSSHLAKQVSLVKGSKENSTVSSFTAARISGCVAKGVRNRTGDLAIRCAGNAQRQREREQDAGHLEERYNERLERYTRGYECRCLGKLK